MAGRQAWIAALALFAFVAATNRYADPADVPYDGPADALAYRTMADAAPRLPAPAPGTLAFHHGQRLALPYAVGAVHRLTGLPTHALFVAASLAAGAGALFVFTRTLVALGVAGPPAVLATALFVLNPWVFRPSLAFAETATDLVFVLGLALTVYGLVTTTSRALLTGVVIAALGRQTALLILPMIVWWLAGPAKAGHYVLTRPALILTKPALAGAAVGIVGIVYAATAMVAAQFSGADVNAVHLLGLFAWMRESFDASLLPGFLARAVLAPALVLALIGLTLWRAPGRTDWTVVAPLLCGFACVAAQPLLGGPAITMGNGPRLSALGLLPLCLALAVRMRDEGLFADAAGALAVAWMTALLALGSLHHWYVRAPAAPGALKPVFGAIYAAVFMLLCVLYWYRSRLSSSAAGGARARVGARNTVESAARTDRPDRGCD